MKLGYRLYYFSLSSTHISLIQKESYQQIPEEIKDNGEHKKRHKLTLESLEFID